MSNEKPKFPDQGLYAFPHSIVVPDGGGGHHYSACAGMSLRDYFAGQALLGMCANNMALNGSNLAGSEKRLSTDAYFIADAMLAARGGK